MRLSVIIVNYNQKYFPKMCLEALKRNDFPCEIFFIDNGSTDESIEFLRQASQREEIVLIESRKNLGYGQGNNLGAEHARGQFLLFINPDVSVGEDSLQKMCDYLDCHPDIGILGPKIVYHNGQIQESCRRFMTFKDLVIKRTFLRRFSPFKKRLKSYLMEDFDHDKIQDVDLLVGACFMFRKEVFQKLSGFDKRYFLFMEDFDLCQNAHKAGFRVVYYPETSVTHYHKRLSDGRLSTLVFKKTFWHHLISSVKYFWRWR